MRTTILLTRHGETAWNRGKVFRGTYDVPLNETGRAQARLLAAVLRDRRIDAGYSSPLSRAVETAAIVLADHGSQAVVEEGLKDINYGDWTGLEEEEVRRRWPAEYDLWQREPGKAVIPAGDSLQTVFDRAFGVMEALAGRHEGQTIALFAHRVVNKLLVLGALGLPIERFSFIRQDNGCLNEFERDGRGYTVVCLNNTRHIDQGGIDLLTADF